MIPDFSLKPRRASRAYGSSGRHVPHSGRVFGIKHTDRHTAILTASATCRSSQGMFDWSGVRPTEFIRRTARAEEGTKAIPSSDSIPAYRAPRPFFATWEPECRPSAHSSRLARLGIWPGALVSPSAGSERSPCSLLVPGLPPKNAQRRPNSLHAGSAVQRSAVLPSSHSFHGEVFSSGRLLL